MILVSLIKQKTRKSFPSIFLQFLLFLFLQLTEKIGTLIEHNTMKGTCIQPWLSRGQISRSSWPCPTETFYWQADKWSSVSYALKIPKLTIRLPRSYFQWWHEMRSGKTPLIAWWRITRVHVHSHTRMTHTRHNREVEVQLYIHVQSTRWHVSGLGHLQPQKLQITCLGPKRFEGSGVGCMYKTMTNIHSIS